MRATLRNESCGQETSYLFCTTMHPGLWHLSRGCKGWGWYCAHYRRHHLNRTALPSGIFYKEETVTNDATILVYLRLDILDILSPCYILQDSTSKLSTCPSSLDPCHHASYRGPVCCESHLRSLEKQALWWAPSYALHSDSRNRSKAHLQSERVYIVRE